MPNKSALPDNDPLQTTLNSLRSDIERTPLADSLSVRRRGEARSRHQAVAGALVVAALVAGVFGVADLRGNERHGSIPAHTSPSPTATVDQQTPLAAQPLLEPTDIGAIGPYTGWKLNPDPENVGQPFNLCVPSPGTLGAHPAEYGHFYSTSDAVADEHVLQFSDSGSAKMAGDHLLAALTTCDLGTASDNIVMSPVTSVALPDADEARVASRLASPPNSEVSYYELGVVQKGDVLVVLEWSSMGLPQGVSRIWDAPRLQTALVRAVFAGGVSGTSGSS
jgi:hypothetical protein